MLAEKISRLILNIEYLGFRQGFLLWRLENQCLSAPDLMLDLIKSTEKEGKRLMNEHPEAGEALIYWATQLRNIHRKQSRRDSLFDSEHFKKY